MLQNLTAINSRLKESGKRKIYDLAHPKFGRDIQIKVNPSDPYHYYELASLEPTRLSRMERQYVLWPVAIEPETLAEARANWTKLKKICVDD